MARADQLWEYRDDLERLARLLCRHPEDAEDVAHSALVKAAEKIDGFRGEASVRTWLHAIATNQCRMLRRRPAPLSLDAAFDSAAADRVDEHLVDDRLVGVDPAQLAVDLERREAVLEAVATLPEQYRCVLMLREGRHLSMEEIAEVTDATVPAVKSTLYRARASLRDRLEQAGHGEAPIGA